MIELPTIAFLDDRWFSWEQLVTQFHRPELALRGAYVVALFDVPPSTVTLPDELVKYIGETHGRSASLRQRLEQFGASAGFREGGQQNGHYAAWAVPTLRGGNIERGQRIDPLGFWFAIVPDRTSTPGTDEPGVCPVLLESMLLWQHVRLYGRLPDLNNSGRQITEEDDAARRAARDAAPEQDIRILLNAHAPEHDVRPAAEKILEAVAGACRYGPARKVHHSNENGIRYAGRHLGAGLRLYVERSDGTVGISLWRNDEVCVFGSARGAPDEAPATSVEGFRTLVGLLWDRWP